MNRKLRRIRKSRLRGAGLSVALYSGGGVSAPVVQASRLDGFNDALTVAAPGPAGAVDGPDFLWSDWVDPKGGDGETQTLFYIGTGPNWDVRIQRLPDGTIEGITRQSDGTEICRHVSTTTFETADAGQWVAIEFTDTASVMRVGAATEGTNTPGTSGNIDLTEKWTIGRADHALTDGFAFDQVWQEDNSLSSFVDETVDANSAAVLDWQFFPAAAAVNDAVYFGHAAKFTNLEIDVGTIGVGTYTVAWQYWNGTAWAAIPGVTDGTTNLKTIGVNSVTFTLPAGWAQNVVNASASLFYVRALLDAGTMTTNPVGDTGAIKGVAPQYYNGCYAEVWAVDESLGLSSDSIAEKFYDSAEGLMRDIGPTGAVPSANVLVYLNNQASTFHINKAGTDFSVVGDLDTCLGPGLYSAQPVASTAPAVDFPGISTDGFNRSNSNVGVADTGQISIAMWIRRDSTSADIVFRSSGTVRNCVTQPTDTIKFSFENSVGTTIFDLTSDNNRLPTQAAWQHVALFVDLATLNDFELYVDGVLDSAAATTFTTAGIIDHTDAGFAIGNQFDFGSAAAFEGGISQFAVWPRKIDWGVPATLQLVRSAAGKAIILPDDGDIDSGGTADYVFNKVLAIAHVNGGDADNWGAATVGLSDATGPEL